LSANSRAAASRIAPRCTSKLAAFGLAIVETYRSS